VEIVATIICSFNVGQSNHSVVVQRLQWSHAVPQAIEQLLIALPEVNDQIIVEPISTLTPLVRIGVVVALSRQRQLRIQYSYDTQI